MGPKGSTSRVALITGGGSGIGRATALRLAGAGYRVTVAGRRQDSLQEVAAECGAAAYSADLRDPVAIADVVDAVLTDHGRLDVLVNNAGVALRRPLDEMRVSDIELLMQTNLYGAVLLTQRCLPALRATHGAIVNISALLGTLPQPDFGIYAASKGGLDAFSRVLALELASDQVRVNVVSPALIRTDMARGATSGSTTEDKMLDARAADYPLGRIGEAEDVAAMIEFLVSPAASWLTGLNITVDGGRLLGIPAAPAPVLVAAASGEAP